MPNPTRLAGYASVFDVPDSSGDVVRPGAFARSLTAAQPVPLLWQHDAAHPIGTVDHLSEDRRGLRVIASLADTRTGRDAAALLRSNALTGLSFGYRVRAATPGEWRPHPDRPRADRGQPRHLPDAAPRARRRRFTPGDARMTPVTPEYETKADPLEASFTAAVAAPAVAPDPAIAALRSDLDKLSLRLTRPALSGDQGVAGADRLRRTLPAQGARGRRARAEVDDDRRARRRRLRRAERDRQRHRRHAEDDLADPQHRLGRPDRLGALPQADRGRRRPVGLGGGNRGAADDRHAGVRRDRPADGRAVRQPVGEPGDARRRDVRCRGVAGERDRRRVRAQRRRRLRHRHRHRPAAGLSDLPGRDRRRHDADVRHAAVSRHRRRRRLPGDQPAGQDHRPRPCAAPAVPPGRGVRDELVDARPRPQDEGQYRRRSSGSRACRRNSRRRCSAIR